MPYKHQSRHQVIKITEMKDGCIFKTKYVGMVWVDIDKITRNTLPLPGESLEQTMARLDSTRAEWSAQRAAYEKQIAKENGGDYLGSMPTSAPYSECFRSIKVE